MDADTRYRTLARAPEGQIRLAEAALWIAADEYPGLDVPAWLRRLDALGRAAVPRIRPEMGVDEAAAALSRFLFVEERFRGNRDDYYDPRNSFLNDVLERRLGIPITLSVVLIEVAAHAGVTVRGVGLPGHFVVRLERGGTECLLDPFGGGTPLGETDCRGLMKQVYGADVPFDHAYLRSVTTGEIVTRMLANLKGIYTKRGDWARALRVVERLLALQPDAVGEVRDRGAIHARLGDTRAAIRDWEAYLQRTPHAPDAERIRENLRAVRQALAVLN